jgi:hypothetical protein
MSRVSGFFSFEMTEILNVLLRLPHKTVAIFSGNQAGKTSSVAQQYVARMLGHHPVDEKNRLCRKVRCMSSTLPNSSNPEEQDNTQYLELRKRIPPEAIISDVTARSQNLVVRRPLGQSSDKTIFEFRSSKQELQDLGKIQLSSVWHDEETPKAHREECKVRLLAEDGDEIFSLTMTNPLSYVFDEIQQNASFWYRSKTIAEKFGTPRVEHIKSGYDIACIQMATDDNPTLSLEAIDRIFLGITNPDDILLRRYGVSKQISGRVHKTYDPKICYISFEKTFGSEIPYNWLHARGIDYHDSRTPWSIGWLSCSPENEWFLWKEFHPSIDGPNAYNTYEIAKSIARKSGDYIYEVNLIDPLANRKQPNTLFSTTDDLNRHFDQIRRNEGVGAACYWEGWDTKGSGGRNEVAMRFKNAVRVGMPFNNRSREHGRTVYLPTLWICDTCPQFNKSIMDWRFGEYVASSTKAVNDPKTEPQQKHSHDNMVLECLAKHTIIKNSHEFIMNRPRQTNRRPVSVTGR